MDHSTAQREKSEGMKENKTETTKKLVKEEAKEVEKERHIPGHKRNKEDDDKKGGPGEAQ